jgi:hypothetical protein
MANPETTKKIVAALMGVDAFHLALGKFVAKFSETEALLQTSLWELTGLKSPMAQSVLSGVRTDGAMQYINRIGVAEKWSKARLEAKQHVFDQLGHINKLRNNILHYGAQLEGPDTWRVSNEGFVHTPENISSTVISPKTLKAAESDLDQIDMLLLDMIIAARPRPTIPDEAEAYEDARKYAWQYKPPLQAAGRQKTRQTGLARGRQPRPSRP